MSKFVSPHSSIFYGEATISGLGSFTVQFGDHLRYNLGIICGPIWGLFAVRGSFMGWGHLRACTDLALDTLFQ